MNDTYRPIAPTYRPPTGPGSDADGETPSRFASNVRAVLAAIEDEPNSPADEIAVACKLSPDACERAILHLLGDCRIRATMGRHRIQTFRVSPEHL